MQPKGEFPLQSAEPSMIVAAFVNAGKTGHITLHIKEGRIMQVETTEVKRV